MPTPAAADPTAAPAPNPYYGARAFGAPAQPAEGPAKLGLARWLVILAGLGILGRASIMVACAHRISFADNLLNGGTGTVDDANQADHLVTAAAVFSGIAFLAFIGVLLAIGSRAKRGDAMATAINSNPRVRLFSRLYLIAFIVAFFLAKVFKQDDSASPEDQIRSVTHGDWATIVYNGFVIAFLVAIIVVTRNEIAKARAAGAAA